MVSPAVNVVRYSALLGGVVYGIFHRRTLQSQYDASAVNAEIKKREHWIEEAKKAWAQKQLKTDGVISDPDAPGFDLEALLKSWEK